MSTNGCGGCFRDNENVKIIVVLATQVSEYTKSQSDTLLVVNYIIYSNM